MWAQWQGQRRSLSWLTRCLSQRENRFFISLGFVFPARSLLTLLSLRPFCFALFPLASFPFFCLFQYSCSPECSCAATGEIPEQSASPLKNSCILPCRLNYRVPLGTPRPPGREGERQLGTGHPAWGLRRGSPLSAGTLPAFWPLGTPYLLQQRSRVGF